MIKAPRRPVAPASIKSRLNESFCLIALIDGDLSFLDNQNKVVHIVIRDVENGRYPYHLKR